MAQTQYTEQDAWSLAQKLDQLVQGLTPGEQAAWETLERHVSILVPTEDADVEGYATADQGGVSQRQHLWFRLVTTLNPPRRATDDTTTG